jgi:hypothetical protein
MLNIRFILVMYILSFETRTSSGRRLDRDQGDRRQVVRMAPEQISHADHARSRSRLPRHVEGDPQRAQETFILEHALGFQQVHRCPLFLADLESRVLQRLTPLGAGERLHADVNG